MRRRRVADESAESLRARAAAPRAAASSGGLSTQLFAESLGAWGTCPLVCLTAAKQAGCSGLVQQLAQCPTGAPCWMHSSACWSC